MAAVFLLGLFALADSAKAQTPFSGTYTFPSGGADGNVSSFNYNGAAIDNLTVSAITKNGVTSSSSANNFRATQWPTGATNGSNTFNGSIDLNKYFAFTLTPGDGYALSMTSITFGIGRSGTGTRQTEWRSSIDNFASTISTYSAVNAGLTNTSGVLTAPDTDSGWTGNILDLSAPAFQSLTSATTFRVYFYNAETTSGTAGLAGPLSFNGTMSVAPTPGGFTTWTGGAGTWQNGTSGQFGGNYANNLSNTVSFNGTGGTITASGPPQAGSLVFNADSYILEGAVQLGVGAITTTGSISAIVSAAVSGNGSSGLTKSGAGTLILSGSNSYAGATTISTGILEARHADALGSTASGTTVADGATLATSNDIEIGMEAIGLSGSGSGANGALRNISGNNSIAGTIALNADARIQSDGGALVLTGGITGAGRALAIAGAGATTLSVSGLNTSAGGTLAKADSGTLAITASSSYTGGTSVTGGAITASHNSALGTGAVAITSGAVYATDGITLANDFTIGTAPSPGGSVVLAGWNFLGLPGGIHNFGPSPLTANTTAAGMAPSALVRGPGVLTTGATGGANAWGGINMVTANATAAIQSEDYIAFTIAANGANAFSIGSIGSYNVRRSDTGTTSGLWQFSTDNSTFTDIGTTISWGNVTTAAGNPQSAISLGGISALQNLAAGTAVTFRLALWGATTNIGTWFLNDPGATVGDDFTVLGSVVSPATGSATLGLNDSGTATYSGNLTIHGAATLTASSGATATFSGNFSGDGNVAKTGGGMAILTGQVSHSGGTTVGAGTLRINGTHASAITVQSGATLGGNGSIAGMVALNANANLAPGNGVGTLSFTNGLTLNASSTVTMEINGDSTFDTINVTGGSLAYGGNLNLVFGYIPAVSSNFTLFTGGSVASSTGNLTLNFASNPGFDGTFAPTTGILTLTAIPEPKTLLMLALGASFLLWRARGRRAGR